MANLLDQVKIESNGFIYIRQITDNNEYHRLSFFPGQDVSDQPQDIQDVCKNAWTPEIIAAYQTAISKPYDLGA
jgi:hypothetical protein